jgi:MFS family permease
MNFMVGVRFLAQLDRLAWNYLILAMATEFVWTDMEQGTVKAAFAGGYLLLQIVGGILGDMYSNKAFQMGALVIAGLVMGLAPVMADTNGPLGALAGPSTAAAAYFLMGLACGPQHPTSTAHQKQWCLPAEKNQVSSNGALGSVLGSLLACAGVAQLIGLVGWRATFYVLAAATFLFTVVYTKYVPEMPVDHKTMPEDERQLYRTAGMLKNKAPASLAALFSPSVFKLLTSPAVWSMFLLHGCFNYVRYTLEQEMPRYYVEHLHMSPELSSTHLMTLNGVGLLVPLATKGWVTHAVQSGTVSQLSVRRWSALIGYGIVVAAALALGYGHESGLSEASPWLVTVLLNVAYVGLALQTYSHIANYLDVTETNTGLLMGIGNTVATLPSFISPLVSPPRPPPPGRTRRNTAAAGAAQVVAWLLPEWAKVFGIIAAVGLTISLLYGLIATDQVVDGTGAAAQKKGK